MFQYTCCLNVVVVITVITVIIDPCCSTTDVSPQYWKATVGILRPYLALDVYVQGNYAGVAGVIITFLTFWVLYSYLVPISLFVTMEIVKFWCACHAFIFVMFCSTWWFSSES